MKTKLNIPEEVFMNGDLMNTLNGGVAEPDIKLTKQLDHDEIMLKVPGVEIDDIELEIAGGNLLVYHFVSIFRQDEYAEKIQKAVRLIARFTVPNYVIQENISAVYDEDTKVLSLLLPRDGDKQNLSKKIQIRK